MFVFGFFWGFLEVFFVGYLVSFFGGGGFVFFPDMDLVIWVNS